ncbi:MULTISPECIES: hypothetical protein [Emticicia]|uniref:hypothetical protein n=1 Tax=Emticicia TaxID=312278 RepID=UPI0012E84CC4|nr:MULTISPECIES: hypothetical protein [Emticicia]
MTTQKKQNGHFYKNLKIHSPYFMGSIRILDKDFFYHCRHHIPKYSEIGKRVLQGGGREGALYWDV